MVLSGWHEKMLIAGKQNLLIQIRINALLYT